MQTAL